MVLITIIEPKLNPPSPSSKKKKKIVVDGFGITGYEGVFRSVCEVTMKLLRTNKTALMTVLETFLYDPLVEWMHSSTQQEPKKSHHDKQRTEELKFTNAHQHLKIIEGRLSGFVDGVDAGLEVAVEAQVQQLIEQATSDSNLANMYVGWSAFF